jgi:hypothetical protein
MSAMINNGVSEPYARYKGRPIRTKARAKVPQTIRCIDLLFL